jgi:hypothetical protein
MFGSGKLSLSHFGFVRLGDPSPMSFSSAGMTSRSQPELRRTASATLQREPRQAAPAGCASKFARRRIGPLGEVGDQQDLLQFNF